MRRLRFFFPILVTVFGVFSPTFGLETASRLGAEMKMMQAPAGTGLLFGWRYLFHASSAFSIGGAGYTGQLSSGGSGTMSYGGMVAALHAEMTPSVSLELSLLGGGGGGKLPSGSFFGGTLVEPAGGFGIKLGDQVQLVLGGSYVWLPGAADGSGFSAGIRFEFVSKHAQPALHRNPSSLH